MNASLEAYRRAVAEYEAAELRVKRFADARAAAVWDLARSGWSLARIAGELGVTRARVSQLVGRARALGDQVAGETATVAAGVVVTSAQLGEARERLAVLRAEVRRQAAACREDSLRFLELADALKVTRLEDRNCGEHDWLRGLNPAELRRLQSWWSTSPGNLVDVVADRLRDRTPALSQLGTDEIMRRVWLHHTRIVDAAGAVARGRQPVVRRYSGAVDVAGLAPGVVADGYNVMVLLGDDETAVRHIAGVDAVREQDDAWRHLGASVRCVLGPAPWRMTAESYEAELLAIDAQLRGDDELEVSELELRARRDELVPKLLDDGRDWGSLHTAIREVALLAGLR